VNDTGLFWVYFFPFLAFFFMGLRVGWMFCLAFVAIASVYLFYLSPSFPETHQYIYEIRVHFLLAVVFYTLVAAAFCFLQELSDEKLLAAKDAAESAYRVKSRFLAAASHDIRQPANALGMFVSRLSNLQHDVHIRELLNGVDASVLTLQEMLDAFFDYSKLESEAVGVNLKPISVNRLFGQLRLAFESIAIAKGLTLRIRGSNAWVQSDQILLQRVMLNLVNNAIKYTERGRVLVACRPTNSGEYVRIEVLDTGLGIAENELKMIFEEFYQIDNAQRDREKGLGLGLSMVKRSCELLEHSLNIKSQPGRGTRFSVIVPITKANVNEVVVEIEEVAALASGHANSHVLVIEDDDLSRKGMTDLLISWGYRVSSYQDAQEACASLRLDAAPNIIISDYRLPNRKNGLDAIKAIREICDSSIPSILISGDKNEELRKMLSEEGLFLLTKPVQPAKLRSLLRKI
jgi:signal transduction histidine kinase